MNSEEFKDLPVTVPLVVVGLVSLLTKKATCGLSPIYIVGELFTQIN
jgi:hypothetical protein